MPEEIYEENNIMNGPNPEPDIYEDETPNTTIINRPTFKNSNASLLNFEIKSPAKKKKKAAMSPSSNEEEAEENNNIITETVETITKYNHTCIVMNSHEYLMHHIMKYISRVIYSEYVTRQDIYNAIVKLIKKRVPKNIVTTAKCSSLDIYNEHTGIIIARMKARKRMFEKELVLWNDITNIFHIKNQEEFDKIIDFLNEKINKINEEYNKYLN